MKRVKVFFIAALAVIISFSFFGCTNQTFDDIPYGASEQSASAAVQSFNGSKTVMFNKTVEYETTDINETLSGTETIVTIRKFGKLSGQLFTQRKTITYSGNSESYQTITRYNKFIYTDINGVVTRAADNGIIDIQAFISEFIPTIGENTHANVRAVEEKQFEDINYIRLTVDPDFVSVENSGIQPGKFIVSDYKYEFGIHSQNSYLMLYRTVQTLATDTLSSDQSGNYWLELKRTTTTLLKNSGESVQIIIPVVS